MKQVQRGYLAAAALALLLSVATVEGYIKDPVGPADPTLESIADDLDRHGIDVRKRWSSLIEPDATRPQVARLDGYPAGTKAFLHPSWKKDFEQGVGQRPALLAVAPEEGGQTVTQLRGRPSAQEFQAAWDRAKPSDRIFISYTKVDAQYAVHIRASLEARGYTVFIYRETAQAGTAFSTNEVGRLFRSAGHHFVVDTPAARKSIGVALEANTYRALEAKQIIAKAAVARQQEARALASAQAWQQLQSASRRTASSESSRRTASEQCCERCTLVNGVPTGCVFVGCGAVCAGAR